MKQKLMRGGIEATFLSLWLRFDCDKNVAATFESPRQNAFYVEATFLSLWLRFDCDKNVAATFESHGKMPFM